MNEISKKERIKKGLKIKKYLILSLVIFVFGIIYEYFSHGVYSIYMMGAFVIPLIGGVLVNVLIKNLNLSKVISERTLDLRDCGVITLMIASIILGVVEIYGTTNYLINFLFIVSGIILTITLISLKYDIKN